LIVSLLTASPVSLDLGAHGDLLQLAGTLFAGQQLHTHTWPNYTTTFIIIIIIHEYLYDADY